MGKEHFDFISSMFLLLANIILAIAYFVQFKSVKKELNAIKVVVKDTHEMREALKKPLEGTWTVYGVFKKFQDVYSTHYSTGYVIFTWLPSKEQYEVKYMYCIRKERETIDIATVFCSGYASADKNGEITEKNPLQLNLIIESSSRITNESNHESKAFVLTSLKQPNSENIKINRLDFIFKNKNTEGQINFSR